jgi:NAD(P)-dependent dehydrogenase (short-subunit alcohol dehydrogenase family)
MSNLNGKTAIVEGAGRGMGRGIATSLANAGAHVIALDGLPAFRRWVEEIAVTLRGRTRVEVYALKNVTESA